jgi:hypothetical protein
MIILNQNIMKKNLFYFLAASFVVFASCSKDDDSISEEKLLLPKKEIYTNASYPQENSTVSYVYDGNKIVSLTYDNGDKTNFTYTGNFITSAVYTESYGGRTYSTTTTFTYENNKLKSYLKVYSDSSSSRKKTYTYNTNGTISTTTVSINSTTLEETLSDSSLFTLDSRGNIVKVEFNGYINTVEYDIKKSPFKNILGYSLLLDSEVFDQEVCSVNNISKVIERTGDVIDGTTIFANTYNTDDYLIKSVRGNETFEYTY